MDSRPTNPLALILGLGLALYAVFSITLTQGNSISELCMMLMIGGFLLCLFTPNLGFVIWILSSGYIDLVKRMMVLSGRVTHMDLYYVLGIHPLMLGGMTMALLVGGVLGRNQLKAADMWRLLFAIFFMGATAGMAIREKGFALSSVLADVANSGLYGLLIFIVPQMVPTMASAQRLLVLLIVTYAPVAAYGIVQQSIGFQDFEIDYLMTGLSIEIKQLLSQEVRAFSTLNSPTALSFSCGACAVFCLGLALRRNDPAARLRFPRVLAVLLFFLFVGGMLSSALRAAFVMLPVSLIGWRVFQSGKLTAMFYALLSAAFVTLIFSAKWLLQVLPDASTAMYELSGGDIFTSQLLRVGTYYERLMGFSNCLANPAAYSWFGFGMERGGYGDDFLNHDPLSTILIRYGTLALVGAIVSVALGLRFMHRRVLNLEAGPIRSFGALLLCVPMSFLVATVLQGNVFFTFPLNIFASCCVGLIEMLNGLKSAPKAVTAAPPQPVMQRPMHRLGHGRLNPMAPVNAPNYPSR